MSDDLEFAGVVVLSAIGIVGMAVGLQQIGKRLLPKENPASAPKRSHDYESSAKDSEGAFWLCVMMVLLYVIIHFVVKYW